MQYFKGVPVIRENYEAEKISIAFNPLEERFEVSDAAIQRDKSFIPDISCIWVSSTNIFKIASDHLTGLQSSRKSQWWRRLRENSECHKQATVAENFPFTALQLAAISQKKTSPKSLCVSIAKAHTPIKRISSNSGIGILGWRSRQARAVLPWSQKTLKEKASPFNYFIRQIQTNFCGWPWA